MTRRDTPRDTPAFARRPPPPFRPFTPRQLQIADAIARELTYDEIGAELGIAGSTVRQQVDRMADMLEDFDGFTARQRVFWWARWKRWDESRPRGSPNGAHEPTNGSQS